MTDFKLNKKEIEKEQKEQEVLDTFISLYPELEKFNCKKSVRPDYIMELDGIEIGVEITALTTPLKQNMFRIAENTFGKNRTIDEMREYATSCHQTCLKFLNFQRVTIDNEEFTYISTMMEDVCKIKECYVKTLNNKLEKYKADSRSFHRFILLCDCRMAIATNDYDLDEIIQESKYKDYNLSNFEICFLLEREDKVIDRWYKF